MVNGLSTMIRVSVLMSFLIINLRTVSGGHPQLRLVIRHGDRAPDVVETFRTDAYRNHTFYPTGRGGLTSAGKRRVYHFGKLLRLRYDNFLGPFYTPSIVDARSLELDRTKTTLQLMLAGIFPPKSIQRWNKELRWQPIPISYSSANEDHILNPGLCRQWITEYNRVVNRPEVKKQIAEFDRLMAALEPLTGQEYNDMAALYRLYYTFESQEASDLKLPRWAYDLYPRGQLLDAAKLNYTVRNYNDKMKRLGGGMLLKKMLDDASSYKNGSLPEGRKLYLYSARATHVASIQSALGVRRSDLPAYSSASIMEIWEDAGKYYVKVLYYTGTSSEIVTQTVPGCSELCPLVKFMKLRKRVIASEADLQCN